MLKLKYRSQLNGDFGIYEGDCEDAPLLMIHTSNEWRSKFTEDQKQDIIIAIIKKITEFYTKAEKSISPDEK